MPTAVTRPSSSRATRSASMTVDGRCATISAVVVASTRRSPASTRASVSTSSAESGSSSTSTAGRRGDRTGERETLALAAGEAQALLADAGLRAVGELRDEVRLRDLERLGEHRIGIRRTVAQLGPAEQHVLAHRRREQGRVLERHRDVPTQLLAGEVADVDAVEAHGAAGHVVQTGRERGQRRLARPGQADERHRLARLELEVDAVEDVGLAGRPQSWYRKWAPSNASRPVRFGDVSRVLGVA